MAAHDDLVLIINQLLQGLDKIGDSLSVVKAIGEDVRSIGEDVKMMKDEIVFIKRRVVKIEERIGSIDSETNADISDRVKNTEIKLVSMEETMNKLMLSMENATLNRSIDSETNADISDRVKNTERKLVSMEETMNKLMLTMENATQNSKVEEKSNYAFDAIFKGKNIELSNDQRTASRLRWKGNRGPEGVISNSMLKEDEVFEIIIEETINQWTDCGIAIGVINAKSDEIKETETIFTRITGTWSIFSQDDTEPGKSEALRYKSRIDEKYPLDTRNLKVGSVLGVSRRRNGDLHFYLDGVDCGPAFKDVPRDVYAFVDVVNYVTKIRIYT